MNAFNRPATGQRLRTLLVLGRVSNLPTVWSNCLAGWWLGGDRNYWKLPLLLAGVSLLYTAGMFLNDAFDEEFDLLRRPERPIPVGKISVSQVWGLGFGLLAAGVLLLTACGKVATACAILLAISIVLYDFTHKFLTASPWLMGLCRFWVYVIASATGVDGLNGFGIFGGAAMAFYVVGLSYIARRESSRAKIPVWPLSLLAAPVIVALTINAGSFRLPALWISFLLGLWVVRYVRFIFLGGEINAGWIVSNLLAGIVLVDWLAVAPILPAWLSAVVFLSLFGIAKWMQKSVPAS